MNPQIGDDTITYYIEIGWENFVVNLNKIIAVPLYSIKK